MSTKGLTFVLVVCCLCSVFLFGYTSSQDYFERELTSVGSDDHNNYKIDYNKEIPLDVPHPTETLTELNSSTPRSLLSILQEVRHAQQLRTQDMVHLKEIPKKFEVSGSNTKAKFMKTITDIQSLAEKENSTILYSVKVEVVKTPRKNGKPVPVHKKTKSKKFNVPLKKKSMRLSNFEKIMKKLADTNGQKVVINPVMTTEDNGARTLFTTTKIPVMKYKPILGKNKIKYAKKSIRPVRKQEITLTSNVIKAK